MRNESLNSMRWRDTATTPRPIIVLADVGPSVGMGGHLTRGFLRTKQCRETAPAALACAGRSVPGSVLRRTAADGHDAARLNDVQAQAQGAVDELWRFRAGIEPELGRALASDGVNESKPDV